MSCVSIFVHIFCGVVEAKKIFKFMFTSIFRYSGHSKS